MGKKKVYTEEELKERQRERAKKYYYSHKAERIEKVKEWQDKNKDKVKEYCQKASIKWYHSNVEKAREIARMKYELNKEREKERHKTYTKTPMGRASYLRAAYIREDRKYERGECDLTAKWIVDNIFSKPCTHCGESDWTKIGCNRLDNSKPHTMDNVEPCCWKCNLLLESNNRNNLGQFVS